MLLICIDCSEIRMIPFNSGIVNMLSVGQSIFGVRNFCSAFKSDAIPV